MRNAVYLAILVWSTTVWGMNFGINGRDGRSGLNGQNGVSGQDATVMAQGRNINLNLRGQDGSDGADAEDGQSAYSCIQRRGMFNEYGAGGGDGGNAGLGGNGGNGGNVTVFYDNTSDLNKVLIDNSGGRAGQAGRAGYGGRGCYCTFSHWTHQICNTRNDCTTRRVCDSNGQNCRDQRTCRPVRECRYQNFSCFNGQDGRIGQSASRGREGSFGQIRVVKGFAELPVQRPSLSVGLEALSRSSVELSKQIWRKRNDGHKLFASGSRISGEYLEFVKLSRVSVKLDWRANRNISDFANKKLQLTFDGNQLAVSAPNDLLLDYQTVRNGDAITLIVNHAFSEAEVKDLKISATNGYGKNLVIKVKDNKVISDSVGSKVKLQFVHRKLGIWYVVYDKEVPSSALEITADGIQINVGELGIGSAYIAKGKLVRYTLWIERSLGNQSTEVKLHQSARNLK